MLTSVSPGHTCVPQNVRTLCDFPMSSPHVPSTFHTAAPQIRSPKRCVHSEYARCVSPPRGRRRCTLGPLLLPLWPTSRTSVAQKASPSSVRQSGDCCTPHKVTVGRADVRQGAPSLKFSVPSRHSPATSFHWPLSTPASSPITASSAESSLLPPPEPEAALLPLQPLSLESNTALSSVSPAQPFFFLKKILFYLFI